MMSANYRLESHFGALGWLVVQWQAYRERIGCHRLPCEHVICRMYRDACRCVEGV